MSREITERIKTIFIYILFVSGLLQVGILWSYQNQGTPISFLERLFSNDIQISNEAVRETLFMPDRIVVSDGEYSNSHWVITEGNEYYNSFWNEAAAGLVKIADGKVKLAASAESWDNIVERRGFLVDFKYTVEPGLLGWFLGIGDPVNDMPEFRKLMIKRDIINDDIGTFYLYGSDGIVYASDPIRYEKAVNLNSAVNKLYENVDQLNRRYYSFAGSNIQKKQDEPDVLYAAVSPRYWPYPVISAVPPDMMVINDSFEAIILGSDAGRYNKYIYNENITQFTYGSNIYRYYSDGYLTYRYLGSAEQNSKSRAHEALMNVYQFVVRKMELYDTQADITLTSVEKKAAGIYKFGFDYRIDGMPVRIDYDMKDGNGDKLQHAISIMADSKRVLECDWLFRNFRQVGYGKYNDRLLELMGKYEILFSGINIQQIDTGFYIDNKQKVVLEPALIIDTKEDDTVLLNLLPEEGE
ncbi:MAG: hypothetical protein GX279_07490 [Clostridiaceae bacterium]|nr:hypothetical protein [Clostridiaceae bacterium]